MASMRHELDLRPLVAVAVGLAAGISGHWLGLLILLAALAIAIRPGVRLAILAAATAGLLLSPSPVRGIGDRTVLSGEGTVASVPRLYPDTAAFVLETGSGRFLATAKGRPEICLGDRLRFEGAARPPSEPSRTLYANRGLHGRLKLSRWATLARGPSLFAVADAWRRSFLNFAERTLPKERAAVASALAFNLDTLLGEDQTEAFRRGGTLHIVSVSGAHVVMLSGVLGWILGKTPLPRGGQIAVLALLLAFYAVTAGLGPPIVRAALMGLAFGVPYLSRREGDFPSGLAIAVLVVLLWQPRALREVGFQLSFVTVGAMGLFGGTSEIRQGFVASFASLPLVAYHFAAAPILAVPANLLIALGVTVTTVGGIGSHLLSFPWPGGGAFAMKTFIDPCVRLIEDISRWVGSPEWAVVRFPYIPDWAIVAVYAALIALWRPRRREVS
ncbi:ComEC/Rec2 family competence protein [bacterium]|nr:MAG: ComEC/Rec2 family competence protein [bacterium]